MEIEHATVIFLFIVAMLVCETGVCSMSRSCSQCTALGSADIRSDYHKVKTVSTNRTEFLKHGPVQYGQ